MTDIIPYGDGCALAAINEGQRAMLTQKTPPAAILTRRGKAGKTFSYVPHAWVTEKLNEAFGWAWSWDIQEWRAFPEADPTEVFVLGKLTVHAPSGDLVKSQFGSSDVKRDKQNNILSLGDELKSASSDALKKAASLLGIGLDLYHADVKPADDDRDTGLSDDPMTVFWAAAKAKGLTQAEGAALLQKHKGNPDKSLAELTNAPAPQPMPAPAPIPAPVATSTGDGNGHKVYNKADFIERIRALEKEAEDLGMLMRHDQTVLDEAKPDEIKRIGRDLKAHVDALKAAQAEQPALLDEAA